MEKKIMLWKFIKVTRLYILGVPVLIWLLGAALNNAVLVANHDTFPVMENQMKVSHDFAMAQKAEMTLLPGFLDKYHVIMTKDTHLNWLADWIDRKDEIDSPGDILLDAGEYLMGYAPLVWALTMINALYKEEDN